VYRQKNEKGDDEKDKMVMNYAHAMHPEVTSDKPVVNVPNVERTLTKSKKKEQMKLV
jgi:hypothetical protein